LTLLNSDDLFAGPGEMAALMRATDWSATPLGPPQTWPFSLRTIVRVLLTSRFAMWLGWGPDLTFLYNDAYKTMTLGAKHPWALGRPSRDVWAEIWPEVGPRIERVLKTGEATWDEDLRLFLERSGYPEETYHTFSYSPVTDDAGNVCGLLCVVTEQTLRVVSERRVALLRDTAAAIAGTNSEAELCGALTPAIEAAPYDLPMTLAYLCDDRTARLACSTGIAAGHAAALEHVPLGSADAPWPIDAVLDSGAMVVVDDLPSRVPGLPAGPWTKPPDRAAVVPIAQAGQRRPAGVFVAALNPFRPLDDDYRSFIVLLVGQIAAGLANVRAYEAERRRAQALAEVDRAKTTFFSNVSHEFRTPLTLMMTPLADLLAAPEGLAAETRAILRVVHRNGLRLLKLVNTLLDFSRIEAGREVARYGPVDLGAFTADLASTFRSAMERAGLAFTVACPPLPEPVYVDRDMWEKIVLNLLSNAFKYTLQGGVAVRVTAEEGHAVLEVQDSGSGIPAKDLPRLFERFHRVEGAHARSHEGSGIGLALVHELVKLHGGEIAVDSQVGVGTRFRVTIPIGAMHLPAEHVSHEVEAHAAHGIAAYVEEALRWLPSTDAPAGATPADAAAPGTARVLVADDNADMRDYMRRLLGERWVVETAGHGREALEAARRHPPDVIVTDVMMPEMDGFALLRALHAEEGLRDVPVILLSARAGEEARLEGLAAGADDYLVKPFSARELVGRVDAQLLKGRARAIERHHTRRLEELFSHAPVPIAIVRGPRHVYELANPAHLAILGRRDVIGRPAADVLPELASQGVFGLLDQVRTTREPLVGRSLRVSLQRGPGGRFEEVFVDFVAQPVFETGADTDPDSDAIMVVAHEVTALARAKQEAEAANRLKDEFLATLSHELRTPLNAVLGYTQMVRAGVIGPDRLPAVLETIERNAQLQERLVSDVLDVSRIVTGKLRLDVRPIDLARVIHDAVETVAPAAAAKGLQLQADIRVQGVPVSGDAHRLQQVIWNLLSNSVKFTPPGGRVGISLDRVDGQLEIAVSDTGEGIAAEFLPHLFYRFSQADGSFARRHSGLGLGLALSRHLVEAHGGVIDASSPGVGRGTTVRVRLPLLSVYGVTLDGPGAGRPVAAVDMRSSLALADLTGVHVLLVDDDVDALEMTREVLNAAGAQVAATASPDRALTLLDAEPVDVAVIDLGMPEVDGYELLRRIRENAGRRQASVPAAALTAYARAIDRTRSLDAGFQVHLTKPVHPRELAEAVLALARGRIARTVDQGSAPGTHVFDSPGARPGQQAE